MEQRCGCPYLHHEPPDWIKAWREPDGRWAVSMPEGALMLFERAAQADGVHFDTFMEQLLRRFLVHLDCQPPATHTLEL